MPWKYLETKVQFPNPEEPVQIGEIRYGKIIFIPQEDLFVDSIGYYIFRINTTPPQEETIFEEGGKTLLNRTTLERGKEYEFEFPFEGKYPVTYSGKNIGVHWEVKTFVHLRTEEYLTIRKDSLSSRGVFCVCGRKDRSIIIGHRGLLLLKLEASQLLPLRVRLHHWTSLL